MREIVWLAHEMRTPQVNAELNRRDEHVSRNTDSKKLGNCRVP